MVAKCTGIIPIIPDLVSASGMKIGAVYKRVYGFTDLRGRPAGRGRARRGPPNQVTAGRDVAVVSLDGLLTGVLERRGGGAGASPSVYIVNTGMSSSVGQDNHWFTVALEF